MQHADPNAKAPPELRERGFALRTSRERIVLRVVTVLATLIYVVLLMTVYAVRVAPNYDYMGYVLEPAGPGFLLLGVLVAFLPSTVLPVHLHRPSGVALWMLYILAFIPSMVIPYLALPRDPTELLPLTLTLAVGFCIVLMLTRLPLLAIPRLKLPRWVFWLAFGTLGALLVNSIARTFGLTTSLPSLADVYVVRGEYKETEASLLARYAVTWIGNVIGPFLIGLGLLRRAPLLLTSGLALQLLIYATTGFRSVLFSALLLAALFIAMAFQRRYFGAILSVGAASLVTLTVVLDALFDTIVFSSLFVRRLLATPGILTGWYYDFFVDRPKALLGHSVLEPWIDYPYDRLPPLLIGRAYFGNEATYANANVWADAFANFGLAGILAYSVLLGLLLWAFDYAAGQRDARTTTLAGLMLGVPAFTLTNTALNVSLVTHGVLLAWLVVYFMPRIAGRSRSPAHTPTLKSSSAHRARGEKA